MTQIKQIYTDLIATQMKKTILSFLAAIILLTTTAQADFKPILESETATVKNAITNRNEQIQTLICPFIQTKKMAVLKEEVITKGLMQFQKEDRFRWEYTGENPFVFVQNGEKYYTQMNGKVSEIKDNSARLFQEIATLVTASINGDILENTKKFTIEYQENSNLVLIHLTPIPKSMRNFISKIKLYFNKTNYLVSKIEILEGEEDMTTIQFENVKVNQNINPQVFELK